MKKADMDWWQAPAEPPSEAFRASALVRQASLTKPPGSLGRLEALAVNLSGMQRRIDPQVQTISIRIFAGDHGVIAEGVSAFPQEVTVEMIRNFARGGAAISVLARQLNADFSVINVGTVASVPELDGVVDNSLAPGTANFALEPAMTDSVFRQALTVGATHVPTATDIFLGGEMGIGNTTAAAALTSAILGLAPDVTVGRGTGLDEPGLANKCLVVERALSLHCAEQPDIFEIARRLGGLEIAALTGAYISAAQKGIPIMVDGYICTAAALIACRLNPSARDWMLFSHRSAEPGHGLLLGELAAEPLLEFDMCLGEGSGAALVISILQSACHLHNRMATFAEAGVSGSGTQ